MNNYKEKYEQAVEKIRNLFEEGEKKGYTIVTYRKNFEEIFPELKKPESEDEKIKACICMCLTDVYEQRFKDFNVRLKDCLDWVVKQGEKPQRMISAEAKEDLYNKSAWSEKDEEMLKSVMATCELAEQERDSSPARHLLEMQLNWLKSIKQKIEDKL